MCDQSPGASDVHDVQQSNSWSSFQMNYMEPNNIPAQANVYQHPQQYYINDNHPSHGVPFPQYVGNHNIPQFANIPNTMYPQYMHHSAMPPPASGTNHARHAAVTLPPQQQAPPPQTSNFAMTNYGNEGCGNRDFRNAAPGSVDNGMMLGSESSHLSHTTVPPSTFPVQSNSGPSPSVVRVVPPTITTWIDSSSETENSNVPLSLETTGGHTNQRVHVASAEETSLVWGAPPPPDVKSGGISNWNSPINVSASSPSHDPSIVTAEVGAGMPQQQVLTATTCHNPHIDYMNIPPPNFATSANPSANGAKNCGLMIAGGGMTRQTAPTATGGVAICRGVALPNHHRFNVPPPSVSSNLRGGVASNSIPSYNNTSNSNMMSIGEWNSGSIGCGVAGDSMSGGSSNSLYMGGSGVRTSKSYQGGGNKGSGMCKSGAATNRNGSYKSDYLERNRERRRQADIIAKEREMMSGMNHGQPAFSGGQQLVSGHHHPRDATMSALLAQTTVLMNKMKMKDKAYNSEVSINEEQGQGQKIGNEDENNKNFNESENSSSWNTTFRQSQVQFQNDVEADVNIKH